MYKMIYNVKNVVKIPKQLSQYWKKYVLFSLQTL